jgi:transposase InsO family protein
VKNFTFDSAALTELTKKDQGWKWGKTEQEHFERLKRKLAEATALGVPRNSGEIVMMTDASDVGGGSTLFQWQNLEESQVPSQFRTKGIFKDGTLDHTYPPNFRLVPIGHWNWKWNPARKNYSTYEQEILAGVLTFSSQFRILSGKPVVWFCDNQAMKTFLDNSPPDNPRVRRWFVYLSQFQLVIHHIPGLKNELCDYLSRTDFDAHLDRTSEEISKDAFTRMDRQLDLCVQVIDSSSENIPQPDVSTEKEKPQILVTIPVNVLRARELKISDTDYLDSDYSEIWSSLNNHETKFLDEKLFHKHENKLFVEGKLAVPENKIPDALHWSHFTNGHPGKERTVWFFLKHFDSNLSHKELLVRARDTLEPCETCLRAKPNTALDRGLASALPIPSVANEVLFVDFISLDTYDNFDYVLTMVDSLTRFAKFVPCNKHISGESVLKIIQKEWIQHYDKPKIIFSDNDVRFSSEKGFYQETFRAMGIKTNFSLPRHPQSNGLCERTNRSFIQNMRALLLDCDTTDWPKLIPYVTWIHNSQVCNQTSFSPTELFLGRQTPTFTISTPFDPLNLTTRSWLEEHLSMQEKAKARLLHLRSIFLRRANKGHVPGNYKVGDYVLIHRKRWPQMRIPKLESPWLGPFRVQTCHQNSLEVIVSPSLGGLIKVAMSMVRAWNLDPDIPDENDKNDEDSTDSEDLPEPMREDEPRKRDEATSSNTENLPPRKEFFFAPRSSTEISPGEENKDANDLPAENFYNVKKILKHKFRHGWRFLVHWEGYPLSSSTWEPISSFLIRTSDGPKVNSIFEAYCFLHDLSQLIDSVLEKERQRGESPSVRPDPENTERVMSASPFFFFP